MAKYLWEIKNIINDAAYCELIMPNKYSIAEDKSKYYLVIILKKMKYIFVHPFKNKHEAHKDLQNFFTKKVYLH